MRFTKTHPRLLTAPVLNLIGVEHEVAISPRSGQPAAKWDSAHRARVVNKLVRQMNRQFGSGRALATSRGETADAYLHNGACVYNDHNYLEYCTPAVADTADAVAAIAAGDRLMQTAVDAHHGDSALRAVRNNVDYKGHSCGAHVNVRMSRAGFAQIFANEELLHNTVVPLFVALPVICGSGRAGSEDGYDGFEIWQRGPFLETVAGPETMHRRPIVNSRDECLAANSSAYARLHVIHLDANHCEVAEYCKLGLVRLLCATIDALHVPNFQLALAEPLQAVRKVTRKPQTQLRLANGRRASVVEIVRRYIDVFMELCQLDLFDDRVPDAAEILAEVDRVVTCLEKDPFQLVGSLDWVTKLAMLEGLRARHRLAWTDPQIRWADICYHAINGPEAANPSTRRVTSDPQIDWQLHRPPRGLRATVRSALLRTFAREIAGIDWSLVVSRTTGVGYLLPDDPPGAAAQIIRQADSLDAACLQLGLRRVVATARQETSAASSDAGESERLATTSPNAS